MAFVPAPDEHIVDVESYMGNFPNSVAGERAVRISQSQPVSKSIVESAIFLYDDLERQTHMRTELHEWIERVFICELELRLRRAT